MRIEFLRTRGRALASGVVSGRPNRTCGTIAWRSGRRLSLAALFALAVSACARDEPPLTAPQQRPVTRSSVDPKTGTSASPRLYAADKPIPKGGGSYKVGVPYQVSGRWYYPKDDPRYDRTGVASWYGDDFHGRKTANSEIYDMMAMSAAHTTLPMPSYAWVTNLENGRTVLVRINDRGPYAHERVIDLSRAAARALGSEVRGLSQVRVRYAGPAPLNGDDRREQAYLRSQPWYGNVAQAPQRAPSRLPYMRPYAEATGPGSEPGPAATWRPSMALGAPRVTLPKAETATAASAAPATVAPEPVAPEPVKPEFGRLLIAGAFRSEANAQRRVAELLAFVPLHVVSLTTAIGTVYQVRSAAMPADVALRLLGSMTAGGVKDIMLAGKAARR